MWVLPSGCQRGIIKYSAYFAFIASQRRRSARTRANERKIQKETQVILISGVDFVVMPVMRLSPIDRFSNIDVVLSLCVVLWLKFHWKFVYPRLLHTKQNRPPESFRFLKILYTFNGLGQTFFFCSCLTLASFSSCRWTKKIDQHSVGKKRRKKAAIIPKWKQIQYRFPNGKISK